METVHILIDWCGGNYGAAVADGKVPGSVVATSATLAGIKVEIASALRFHVAGMEAAGDGMPAWLRSGDYQLDFKLTESARQHANSRGRVRTY